MRILATLSSFKSHEGVTSFKTLSLHCERREREFRSIYGDDDGAGEEGRKEDRHKKRMTWRLLGRRDGRTDEPRKKTEHGGTDFPDRRERKF